MDREKISIVTVVSTCGCAIIWNINLFLDLAYGNTNSTSFVLHILCAIVWDISAIVWVLRYLKSIKE